jgi:hypothetical protein
MHPTIASFSSWRFYNGALATGVCAHDRPGLRLFGKHVNLALVHVEGREAAGGGGTSRSNAAVRNRHSNIRAVPQQICAAAETQRLDRGWQEARCCAELVRHVSDQVSLADVGVITPYAAQVTPSCLDLA